jgi:hypothetical protein
VLTQMPVPHPTSNILGRDVSFSAEIARIEPSIPEESLKWVHGRAFHRIAAATDDDWNSDRHLSTSGRFPEAIIRTRYLAVHSVSHHLDPSIPHPYTHDSVGHSHDGSE